MIVSLVPPSAVSKIAFAKLAVDFIPIPPSSERSCIDAAPSVTDVPWSE